MQGLGNRMAITVEPHSQGFISDLGLESEAVICKLNCSVHIVQFVSAADLGSRACPLTAKS